MDRAARPRASARATASRRSRSATSSACSSRVALVHEPELLVLDEPFSGLDPVGVDVMSGVLRERADEGVPVVFSSHQLELVERLCEDVAIVNRGRLVAAGAVDELRERGRGGAEQVRVRVEGDGDGAWLAGVPGAELAGTGARGLLVRLSRRGPAGSGARRGPGGRHRDAFQPRAADARRPVPRGGGGVSGRTAVALVARRELVRAGVREELRHRHGHHARDRRADRGAAERARLRRPRRVLARGRGPGDAGRRRRGRARRRRVRRRGSRSRAATPRRDAHATAASARRRSRTTSSSHCSRPPTPRSAATRRCAKRASTRRRPRQALHAADPLAVTTVEPVDEAAEDRGGFAFVAVLLLYGQLISMGYFVAMGVVEEKSSRVVEVVLSTLRPRHLLAGKILGLGPARARAAAADRRRRARRGSGGRRARGGRRRAGRRGRSRSPGSSSGTRSTPRRSRCAAALVSRQEDLQSVISPLTIVLMVGFFVSFAVLEDPDGTLARSSRSYRRSRR